MRATITVRRRRSAPSSYLVGHQTATLLQSLPGVSDIRVESEDACRAVLSYRWRDPGTQNPALEDALDPHGIQLV